MALGIPRLLGPLPILYQQYGEELLLKSDAWELHLGIWQLGTGEISHPDAQEALNLVRIL